MARRYFNRALIWISMKLSKHRFPLGCLVACSCVFQIGGCAYRLPPAVPPSQERVRLIAASPNEYLLRVNTETSVDLPVPADGRVTYGVPWHRESCKVYLFDEIRVGGGSDPLRIWELAVIRNSTVVRKLSLRQVENLKSDQAGYHLLVLSP